MEKLVFLLDKINKDERCRCKPPIGKLPLLKDKLRYPDDVVYFYQKYGGVSLFNCTKSAVSFSIITPSEIVQANRIIIGEACDDDISSSWYIIGKTNNNDYISIDFSLERNGRCYDSHHELHGVMGSCPIVALSFTELLTQLYYSDGNDIYWKTKGYGDAYDQT